MTKAANISISKLVSNTGQIPGLPKNPRLIKDDRFKKLVKSIQDDPEMLSLRECLVFPHGEKFVVIAGNMRLKACASLGHKEIPCKILDESTPIEKLKAITIKDNVPFGEHDFDLLANEWDPLDLNDWGLDFDFEKEVVNGLTDEDSVPEAPTEPKTKLGDIYRLGNHRLMCGDSTSIDAVEQLMNGSSASFCFTSPPYNAGDSEKLSGNTHTTDNKYGMYKDNKDQGDYLSLLNEFCASWLLFCDCLCVNIQQLAGNKLAFIDWLKDQRDRLIDIAIWDKGHGAPQMAKNVMSNRFEYLVFLSKEEMPSRAIPCANFRGTVQNVYAAPPQRANEFSDVHAATFPVHLPEWAIGTFTKANDVIADAFGGTGTTLIACEKTGRTARLMELDPKYCDVIIKRWQEFTGKQAELIND